MRAARLSAHHGRMPTHVVGVDSSTQATKVVVVDPEDGSVVREARRAHPEGTEVDPRAWWTALTEALGEVGTDDVAAIAVAGQQHGMVLCDEGGEPVRDALLWNDTRSADAAHDLVEEFGGPRTWADAVGTVPVASITATKLRWTARHEPDVAERARSVLLPHDWLTRKLRGDGAEAVTDRGDASGTGYWPPTRSATAPTCSSSPSGAASTSRAWRAPARRSGAARARPRASSSAPAPATTWARRSPSAPRRASSSSPSGPRARCSRPPRSPPPTRPCLRRPAPVSSTRLSRIVYSGRVRRAPGGDPGPRPAAGEDLRGTRRQPQGQEVQGDGGADRGGQGNDGEEDGEPAVIDAALIAAAQRVEHYEMAGYGCVRTFAKLLGYEDAAALLQATLDEEGEADEKLTELAETVINPKALEQGLAGRDFVTRRTRSPGQARSACLRQDGEQHKSVPYQDQGLSSHAALNDRPGQVRWRDRPDFRDPGRAVFDDARRCGRSIRLKLGRPSEKTG